MHTSIIRSRSPPGDARSHPSIWVTGHHRKPAPPQGDRTSANQPAPSSPGTFQTCQAQTILQNACLPLGEIFWDLSSFENEPPNEGINPTRSSWWSERAPRPSQVIPSVLRTDR